MAVADIIVTPCLIYYSTPGTSAPADTVAAGGSWPTGWTALGYTKTPLSVEFKREPVEAEIQESLSKIKRGYKTEDITIETTLAELLTSELALAWGGTYSQTAAGASQPAKDELVGGDITAVTERQWGFEGKYVSAAGNTHPIRLFIWKAVCELGAKLEFGKDDPSGIPLRIVANPDMTKAAGLRLFKLQKITAPASS
jgi:hypothetical protein